MLKIVVLAVAYFVAGKLGLLLAIPPGYASAVWPASGIALAGLLLIGMRAWPGVLVGSFLMGAGFPIDHFDPNALLVPLGIAIGATLQAIAGAALVRRFVVHPNVLDTERDIIGFLLLGGPVSCLVSAPIGVSILVAAGNVPASDFLFNVWTWWVGDVIGVLIFAPLLLIFAAVPRDAWRARRRAVALPLLATFVLVVLVFVLVSDQEQRRIDAEFAQRTHVIEEGLKDALGDSVQSLHAIESFFSGSQSVERHEFRTYVRRLIALTPGVQAFSWNPRVTQAEVGGVVAAARADGLVDFQLTERTDDGRLVPVAGRSDYVPVLYIEPHKDNLSALGFDIASNPGRRATLELARDSGAPASTHRLRLVQQADRSDGVLLLLPLYRDGTVPARLEDRRRALRGFIVGVFHLSDLIGAALAKTGVTDVAIGIEDLSAEPERRVLYELSPAAQQRGDQDLELRTTIDFAQRTWTLTFKPLPGFTATRQSWAAWLVLAAGLLFVALFGTFMMILTGRTLRIERVVAERTEVLRHTNEELARTNADMAREIAVRKQAETALALSNRELDAFSYSVSHDLRSPLRAINGFSACIAEDCGGQLNETCRSHLSRIRAATLKMGGLIEDLLRLSRVTRSTPVPVPLELSALVRQTVEELRLREPQRVVEVRIAEHCPARGDLQLLRIALDNLVGNAWKFTREQTDARIEFGCERQASETIFFVRDNGVGFDVTYSDKLFQPFQRLHAASTFEGSGIGLSIVQRIIHRHGGHVWAESEIGRGATFYFTLP